MNREMFLKKATLAGLALAGFPGFSRKNLFSKPENFPPIRKITNGSKFYWYGYYDKMIVDETSRYVLGMEVDFEHRSPKPEDTIKLGMIDLENGDSWTELGETKAWCWQQGCMLQWRPRHKDEIIWNGRENGKFVSYVMNIKTRQKRTLPMPVYSVSPDGKWAITTDFSRIADVYPGYGYAGVPDKWRDELTPKESGIWKMNLNTGEVKLIISIEQIASLANPNEPDALEAKHYFNHLLYNPKGDRFVFLHRWKYSDPAKNEKFKSAGGFGTRMITASSNGKNIQVIDPYNFASHFIWRDNKHILAWSKLPAFGGGFFLYEDSKKENIVQVGKDIMTVNGHCTYLPGNKWVLNDTYPDKTTRQQVPYVFDTDTNKRINLGILPSPAEYKGEWRCDLHPTFPSNRKYAIVQSAHEGKGRQIYLIDLSAIV
jgi:hypothetical protein